MLKLNNNLVLKRNLKPSLLEGVRLYALLKKIDFTHRISLGNVKYTNVIPGDCVRTQMQCFT